MQENRPIKSRVGDLLSESMRDYDLMIALPDLSLAQIKRAAKSLGLGYRIVTARQHRLRVIRQQKSPD